MIIYELERELDRLVRKLDYFGLSDYESYQEQVADYYDIFNEEEMISYYYDLIDYVKEILEGSILDNDDYYD